jgi:arabinofuranosyltransferase
LPDTLLSLFWFGAPFLLYVAHLAWRLSYYGEWLPNTFYAKSADRSWYSQGFVYASTFYLGSHFWILLPAVCAWLMRSTQDLPTRRFKWFTGLGLLAYNLYVVKVGGDFMYGRFYAVVVPLLSLSACQVVLELLRSSRRSARPTAYVTAMVLGASLGGVSLIAPRDIKWGIADERTFYPVSSWNPLTIDHQLFCVGKRFERMYGAGVRLRVASGAIGMIGYYSRFEVIDLLGLTDARVARRPLRERGRPGHEKWADAPYLEERRPIWCGRSATLPRSSGPLRASPSGTRHRARGSSTGTTGTS